MADFVTDSDGIITGVRPLVDTDQPPKMLFMMGGSASGKSSALAQAGGDVEPRNAITLDPDNIKGQLPEYDQMMGSRHPETLPNGTVIQVPDNPDKFAAAGVHEESSDLAKRIQKMAQEAGMNIVVDGTGDNNPAQGNEPSKFAKKILKAKKDGYDVSVFGVNAPTNVAVVDATDRARQTGRYVPEPEMRKIHKNVSANLPEIQRLTENGTISNAQFWDRSRGDMRQIMRFNPNTQSFELLDPKGWQDMLDKATEEPTPAAGMAAARAGAVA
jgi:predicted ABC-type ATPase